MSVISIPLDLTRQELSVVQTIDQGEEGGGGGRVVLKCKVLHLYGLRKCLV